MQEACETFLQLLTSDSVPPRTPLHRITVDRTLEEENPEISPVDEGYVSGYAGHNLEEEYSTSDEADEDGCRRILSGDGAVIDEAGGRISGVRTTLESGSLSGSSDDEDQGLEGGFVYVTDPDIDDGECDDGPSVIEESTSR